MLACAACLSLSGGACQVPVLDGKSVFAGPCTREGLSTLHWVGHFLRGGCLFGPVAAELGRGRLPT